MGIVVEPAWSFTIPSLADDTPLDCRIYHPPHFEAVLANAVENGHATRGAIIAHPYAPLGGNYDDAVVLALVKCLLREGFVVGTFNFRYIFSCLKVCSDIKLNDLQRSGRFEREHELVGSARKGRLHVLYRVHDILSAKTPTKQRRRRLRRWTQATFNHNICTHLTCRWTRQQLHYHWVSSLKYNAQPTNNPSPIKSPHHHHPPLRLLLRLPNPLPPPPNLRDPHPLRKRPSRHDCCRDNLAGIQTCPRIDLPTTRNPTTNSARNPRPQTHTSRRTETTPPSFSCGRRRRRDSPAGTTAQPRDESRGFDCKAER